MGRGCLMITWWKWAQKNSSRKAVPLAVPFDERRKIAYSSSLHSSASSSSLSCSPIESKPTTNVNCLEGAVRSGTEDSKLQQRYKASSKTSIKQMRMSNTNKRNGIQRTKRAETHSVLIRSYRIG